MASEISRAVSCWFQTRHQKDMIQAFDGDLVSQFGVDALRSYVTTVHPFNTILHELAFMYKIEVIVHLVQNHGFNIDVQRTSDLCTPLISTALKALRSVAEELLRLGADDSIKNKHGEDGKMWMRRLRQCKVPIGDHRCTVCGRYSCKLLDAPGVGEEVLCGLVPEVESAAGVSATAKGCSGACVRWALRNILLLADAANGGVGSLYVKELFHRLATSFRILRDVNDVGLWVCFRSMALLPALYACKDLFSHKWLVEHANNHTALHRLHNQLETLTQKFYVLIETPPLATSVVITLYGSLNAHAPFSESFVVHCVSIAGETIATLHMNPEQATVSQVRSVLDREVRIAWDGNAYTFSDFIEYYGESAGAEVWNDCEVRFNADVSNGRPMFISPSQGTAWWDEALPICSVAWLNTMQFMSPDGNLLSCLSTNQLLKDLLLS